ncbi:Y-family DNA polymerase [Agaribacterium sp. ZY112]|uniref:Y-family DNA polymerase n=1 Tax=Agaribacterium sp. ZY112 TaxID=3233574 RepID=UPI00352574E6
MFALCDQRSFYASCETVFRPDLRGKPIVVLSNNDGCVVALNQQAKDFDIPAFAPFFKHKALIQKAGVEVFSSNYALYGEISRRIMSTLESEVPSLEVYSIDEGFCDFTAVPERELKPLAQHLRQRVYREQRIPMGVSVGSTKTLAKLGQYAAKKIPSLNGVCIIENDLQRTWLSERVPVSEVWGVGRRLNKKLTAMGVHTAAQLAAMSEEQARALNGVCLARTIKELNGQSCIPMELVPEVRQSVVCSRSFGEKLTSVGDLKVAVANYVARACEKLRSQDLYAGRLSVYILTSRFDTNVFADEYSEKIPGGSNDSRRIAKLACQIVERIYKEGYRYAKAGVGLIELRPASSWQGDLFPIEENKRSAALMRVMDDIDKKYSRGTVKLACQGGGQRFEMRQERLSSNYLTQWYDIPSVKCK